MPSVFHTLQSKHFRTSIRLWTMSFRCIHHDLMSSIVYRIFWYEIKPRMLSLNRYIVITRFFFSFWILKILKAIYHIDYNMFSTLPQSTPALYIQFEFRVSENWENNGDILQVTRCHKLVHLGSTHLVWYLYILAIHAINTLCKTIFSLNFLEQMWRYAVKLYYAIL